MSRIDALISKSVSVLKPPDDITVSEWADRYRFLSRESSAESGQWRTSRTPYLKEVMDAFTNPAVKQIVFVSASQIGKSEAILNVVGYIVDQDPGSILYVFPTTIDAKEFSQMRIDTMIRDTPCLRGKFSEPKSRDSGNTVLRKSFPGGFLTLCGSQEAHALASKPVRYILGDEADRFAASAGNEGDPWLLALKRQRTFYNAKSFIVSTPTVAGASRIADAYEEGTKEQYCVKCPGCGVYHNIQFADIRFDHETKADGKHKKYKVSNVRYVCADCGNEFSEKEMKTSDAKWIADAPEAIERGVRSFWLNTFISPWCSWETIIYEFLNAKDDSLKLQVVYNTTFGELWEDRGGIEDEGAYMARREEYGAELPDGVLLLTCGIDTQDDRLEYEVVGYGALWETWGIRRGRVMGDPSDDATWDALDEVLDRVWRYADGSGLKISAAFVDEGGHKTQDVRAHARARFSKKLFAVKGQPGDGVPYTSPPKQRKIVIRGKVVGMCWVYMLGVDSGKTEIFDRLRVQAPGAKYCHFPLEAEAGYGAAFFDELLSEHLVYKPHNRQNWVWEKIAGKIRNESLDCRNYANAAAKAISPDFDEIRKKRFRKKGENENANAEKQAIKRTNAKPKQNYFDAW